MRWQFWERPEPHDSAEPAGPTERPKLLDRWTFLLALAGFVSATYFSYAGSQDSRKSAESAERAAQVAQQTLVLELAPEISVRCDKYPLPLPATVDYEISLDHRLSLFTGTQVSVEPYPPGSVPLTAMGCSVTNEGKTAIDTVTLSFQVQYTDWRPHHPGVIKANSLLVCDGAAQPSDCYKVTFDVIAPNVTRSLAILELDATLQAFVTPLRTITYRVPGTTNDLTYTIPAQSGYGLLPNVSRERYRARLKALHVRGF